MAETSDEKQSSINTPNLSSGEEKYNSQMKVLSTEANNQLTFRDA